MKALELLHALRRYKLGDTHVPYDQVMSAIKEVELLQQRVQELEAQLANTEQLTCTGCYHQYSLSHESMMACTTCSCGRKYNFKKDTQ